MISSPVTHCGPGYVSASITLHRGGLLSGIAPRQVDLGRTTSNRWLFGAISLKSAGYPRTYIMSLIELEPPTPGHTLLVFLDAQLDHPDQLGGDQPRHLDAGGRAGAKSQGVMIYIVFETADGERVELDVRPQCPRRSP
jgi:hypothetical protein